MTLNGCRCIVKRERGHWVGRILCGDVLVGVQHIGPTQQIVCQRMREEKRRVVLDGLRDPVTDDLSEHDPAGRPIEHGHVLALTGYA